ncbi:hypothetical protein [Nocardia implantans]|uniref:UsfY protein n=1 Tax=Nocardia implantans TaxID=3108168 RepID=A0ABU6ASI1_9NOCA|nr:MULTISPECIES: hypothetical protein [unclassified Nocardia]MEA3527971.1 hypothetical protein [Nocardia sp. CDC192]MEB3510277.1 hypothetical protein [Nocardia sp. CDC186]
MLPAPNEPTAGSGPGEQHTPRTHGFPDDTRTIRTHAGESIEDARNWPGIILVAVGLVAMALTLTAAGYGFEGWAVVAGIVCGVCIIAGVSVIVAEHRRVKAREGKRLRDAAGH